VLVGSPVPALLIGFAAAYVNRQRSIVEP